MFTKWLLRVTGCLPLSWIKAVSHAQWKSPMGRWFFERCASRFQNHEGEILRGAGKSLRFNPGPANAGYLLGTSEPEFQEVLALWLKPGMTFYDVGANVGFFSMIAARLVGPEGRVICLEPVPELARRIADNARLNSFGNVVVRQEALGAADEPARFLVSAVPTWSKLASPGSPAARPVQELKVTVRRLDSLVSAEGLSPPEVIKIDVEGAEAAVLEGAEETLRRARPLLLVELHGTNRAVAALLQKYEYQARVLGCSTSIENSPWNAQVVAIPGERPGGFEAIGLLWPVAALET